MWRLPCIVGNVDTRFEKQSTGLELLSYNNVGPHRNIRTRDVAFFISSVFLPFTNLAPTRAAQSIAIWLSAIKSQKLQIFFKGKMLWSYRDPLAHKVWNKHVCLAETRRNATFLTISFGPTTYITHSAALALSEFIRLHAASSGATIAFILVYKSKQLFRHQGQMWVKVILMHVVFVFIPVFIDYCVVPWSYFLIRVSQTDSFIFGLVKHDTLSYGASI